MHLKYKTFQKKCKLSSQYNVYIHTIYTWRIKTELEASLSDDDSL